MGRRRRKGRPIKTLLAVSFVLGALLGAVLTSVLMQSRPILELLPGEVYARSITIVGVDERGNGKLATLKVEIKPGSGRMGVMVPPYENEDAQRAMARAKSAAASEVGYSLDRVDILVSIENLSSETTFSGPSASASIALLILAAIRGKENKVPNLVRQDVVISASINSIGRLEPVGKILQKYQTVREAGSYKIFIVSKYQAEDLNGYSGISIEKVADLKQLAELSLR
jgi:predicted S18 family serine protease